jgi:3-isopropylmalate/(R)-2-methylmalate dehydratase small subunit
MSFPPFRRLVGLAAPLERANVDTDVIIRMDRMTSNDPSVLGPFAFEALRYAPDGSEDPSFVLNKPLFRGAPILIAGSNFGCGSSREPAVRALIGLSIRCIIAPSFGDIFESNCFQNGVLAISLPAEKVTSLARLAAGGLPMTVDLASQTLAIGDAALTFEVAPPRKEALLEGLDDLDMSLKDGALIAAWELLDREARPWARPRTEAP